VPFVVTKLPIDGSQDKQAAIKELVLPVRRYLRQRPGICRRRERPDHTLQFTLHPLKETRAAEAWLYRTIRAEQAQSDSR